MSVRLQLIGELKSYFGNQAEITVEAGRTVRETLADMQIRPEIVAGVFVNGVLESKDYRLQEEDTVKLLAVMGGG